MAMWLYQLSEKDWSRNNYRLDVWEGERWEWDVRRMYGAGSVPRSGDIVVFFYAMADCDEPGFYGWAVIQRWEEEPDPDRKVKGYVSFRPVAPSDQLKMHPWWDEEAKRIADEVRTAKQGTLWPVEDAKLVRDIGKGIAAWVSGSRLAMPSGSGTTPGDS